MSYNDIIHVAAGADFRAGNEQHKALAIGGTIAATTLAARGLLQNKPNTGEDGSLLVHGFSKFVAGAAVAAGARVMVTTSGYIITATSGSPSVGFEAENAAVNSGAVGKGYFDFTVGYVNA